MNNEREPVVKDTPGPAKIEKRFQRLLGQLEQHWPELTGAGVASAIVGLGLSLLWARKRIKDRRLKREIDKVVEEELLSDPEAIQTTSEKIGNLAIFPFITNLGERLKDSPLGQEIQVQLAFTRGLLGIRTTVEDTLEEELITAASYVASEGQEQIKALQAGRKRPIEDAPKER